MAAAVEGTRVMPVRVQRRRTKGFRLQTPNGLPIVCVSRPSRWGNPFKVSEFGNLGAIWSYERWLNETLDGQLILDQAKEELRGKNLACFCKVGQPCHADILLKLANDGRPALAQSGR